MAPMSPTPELLRVTEAALVAGVSLRTMRRWVTSGRVVTVGRGRTRRVVARSLSELGANGDTDGHEDPSPRVTVSATSDTRSANGDDGDSATVTPGAMGANGDTEAVTLAALVAALERSHAENRELAAVAGLWQERARVLAEQLALRAPAERPGASHLTPDAPDPTPGPSPRPEPFPWPMPPSPNVRAVLPWLVTVLVVVAVLLVVVPR